MWSFRSEKLVGLRTSGSPLISSLCLRETYLVSCLHFCVSVSPALLAFDS